MQIPVFVEDLNDAVARGTAKQRSEIFERITDLFIIGSADYSDDQIEVFDDVFVRLVSTLELSTRTVLAGRLAKHPRAPTAISRILASDDEIDVAGPVLEHSVRLDNATLIASASTKSQRHLLAISGRNSLDEVVTEVLVERGDNSVVLRTGANPGARFSDKGYTTLVRRSKENDEIATTVALRRDVPRQHLVRLARASDAVRRKLEAVDPQFSTVIQNAVADGVIMIMDSVDIASQNPPDRGKQVESLQAAKRLG